MLRFPNHKNTKHELRSRSNPLVALYTACPWLWHYYLRVLYLLTKLLACVMLVLGLSILCAAHLTVATGLEGRPFAVVGYLPEWRYEGANYDDLARYLSHLLLFSLEPNPDGSLGGLDRFPGDDILRDAREATRKAGTKLLVCFGGNGRSSGFSTVVRSSKKRARFVAALASFVAAKDLDGVDFNWEYPGYVMGRGYQADPEVQKDYKGLALLAKETRAALAPNASITLAYYPDSRQEASLARHGVAAHVDLFHAMSYDAGAADPGADTHGDPDGARGHAPLELARRVLAQFSAAGLPAAQVTVGVPFYGRHSTTGDWTTYEDLVQRHDPLPAAANAVPAPDGRGEIRFNGATLIAAKVVEAAAGGAGGVMIWESGQDCRQAPVARRGRVHARTCPGTGDAASLHAAVARAMSAAGVRLSAAAAPADGREEL